MKNLEKLEKLEIYLSNSEDYNTITFIGNEGYAKIDGVQVDFHHIIEVVMSYNPEKAKQVAAFFGGMNKVKRLIKKSRYRKPMRQLKYELSKQDLTIEEWLEQCYALSINPLPLMREKGINVRFSFNSGPLYFGELPIEEYVVILDSNSNDVQVVRGEAVPK